MGLRCVLCVLCVVYMCIWGGDGGVRVCVCACRHVEGSEDNLQEFHYVGLVDQKEVIRLGSSGYTELSYGLL